MSNKGCSSPSLHTPTPLSPHPSTLSDHALLPNVRLQVLLGDVLGPRSELHKGVDSGLALGLPGLGLLHDPVRGEVTAWQGLIRTYEFKGNPVPEVHGVPPPTVSHSPLSLPPEQGPRVGCSISLGLPPELTRLGEVEEGLTVKGSGG
jgi:hypothetical protein